MAFTKCRLTDERGTETLFLTDAAQTFGKEVPSLRSLNADMISISGHKIYGPQEIGALLVRRRGAAKRAVQPLVFGGSQERGLRPGTVLVALAVGLGEAARLAGLEWESRRSADRCPANQARDGRVFVTTLIRGTEKVSQEPNHGIWLKRSWTSFLTPSSRDLVKWHFEHGRTSPCCHAVSSSCDNLTYRLPELDLQTLVAGHFEGAGVEAELGEDGGVDVGDVVAVFGGMEADFIR